MADEGLDYDDLISQNILIRREEKEDKTATVEVLTKQNDDYENLYQKQAEIYHMDVDLQGYTKTPLGEKDYEDEDNRSDDSSDYEVVVKPVKRDLSPDYDEQDSSSDSDWEVTRKPKTPKGTYQCDECDKKCATKHGLLMHKRSHERQKLKMRKEETPPQSPPASPPTSPHASPDQAEIHVKVQMGGKELGEGEQQQQDEKEKVEEEKSNEGEPANEGNTEEEEDVEDEEEEEEVVSPSPVGNGETPEDDEDDEEETDLNG